MATPTYAWWGVVFSPSNATGYMKMLDGVCQNIFTDTGTVVDQDLPMEYTCTSMDVATPSWYNATTDTP